MRGEISITTEMAKTASTRVAGSNTSCRPATHGSVADQTPTCNPEAGNRWIP